MTQEIIIILVMAVPMILFGVYPGLKLGEFLERKYNIGESLKRKIMIITTVVFTLTLSSLLYYI
ncbi:hypothetical protein [Sulfurimonas sp. CS5]|jgi:hypothetical protein|uniref:hypothetical protein n=1 Tax=Sulfurimonas sp. CS5 TaxID=3391145 RepID=UPI0039EC2E48